MLFCMFFFILKYKTTEKKYLKRKAQKYKISHPQINAILLEKRFDLDDFRLNQKVFWQIVLSKNRYIKRNHFRFCFREGYIVLI